MRLEARDVTLKKKRSKQSLEKIDVEKGLLGCKVGLIEHMGRMSIDGSLR